MNPNFQEFPKTYENLRQRPFNHTHIAGNIRSATWPKDEYIARMRAVWRRINEDGWRNMVESLWLSLHFVYRGKRRKYLWGNGDWYDKAWRYFTSAMVGYPTQLLTRNGSFYRLSSYLNDLYPDFLSRDPFTDPDYFKFPYENLSLDHMYLVYQMPDRFDLLHLANERKMNFDEFFDYVINHIMNLNELSKKGEQLYTVPNFGQGVTALYVVYRKFDKAPMRYINKPPRWTQKPYER